MDDRHEDDRHEDDRHEDDRHEDDRPEDEFEPGVCEEDDLLAESDPVSPRMHDGIPISGYNGGEPIPDLNALPRERWRDVLRPLRPWTRRLATTRIYTQADVSPALAILGDLSLEDAAAAQRAVEAPPPRMPAGGSPAIGSRRQINFRLGPSEQERLLAAAKLFAMRPTTLARVLTMRGVDRALYEERRDR